MHRTCLLMTRSGHFAFFGVQIFLPYANNEIPYGQLDLSDQTQGSPVTPAGQLFAYLLRISRILLDLGPQYVSKIRDQPRRIKLAHTRQIFLRIFYSPSQGIARSGNA